MEKKSRPAQPGVDNIPKIAELPDSYGLIKKASEEGEASGRRPNISHRSRRKRSGSSIRSKLDRDLNAVGLLHFGDYGTIQDIAERRLLPEKPLIPIGHDLLDARTVVSRQSAYLANVQQSDSIFVSIDAWLDNPFLAGHPAPEMAPIRLFMNCEMVLVAIRRTEDVGLSSGEGHLWQDSGRCGRRWNP